MNDGHSIMNNFLPELEVGVRSAEFFRRRGGVDKEYPGQDSG